MVYFGPMGAAVEYFVNMGYQYVLALALLPRDLTDVVFVGPRTVKRLQISSFP